MSLYLIKSGLCLLVLLGAYYFLLEKEKMLRFNRIYLLFSLVFSLAVPFIPMHVRVPALTAPVQYLIPGGGPVAHTSAANNISAVSAIETGIPWIRIVFGIYALVAFGLLLRFGRNLWLIARQTTLNHQQPLGKALIVLVNAPVITHTFFRSIFVNEKEFTSGGIEPEVMMHELAHVRQLHTLDIILIEILQVIFWFNPILILYRRAIQLNHEFLADEAVVEKFGAPKEYQYLLLQKVGPARHLALSSPLNYRITKKRLLMIAQNTNTRNILIKKISLVPLLAIAIFSFSTPVSAQQTFTTEIELRTLNNTEALGKKPYVEIDGKEYPPSILETISPSCVRSHSTFSKESAVVKFGPKAADGAVVITTHQGKILDVTTIERDNLTIEKAARTGFFHRIVLKKEDGSDFDKLIVNWNNGSMSITGDHNSKAAFLVENKLFTEDQIGEVKRLVEAMPNPGQSGVGGNNIKKIPGVDLSSYDMVIYFDSKDSMDSKDSHK